MTNTKRALTGLCIALLALLYSAPAFADRPPSWLIGRFRGFNQMYHVEITFTIESNGRVSASGRRDDGSPTLEQGFYEGGLIVLNSRNRYLLDRTGRGFRLTEERDRSNRTEYRRIDGGGDWDNGDNRPDPPSSPPSWMVGFYEGYNRKYDLDIDLTVTSRGRVTSVATRRSDGRRTNQSGNYQEGALVIGGNRYRVERSFNGVRLIEARDSSNRTDYRRSRGPSPDDNTGDTGQRPPSWLVGRFEGYNDKYQTNVEITITSSGRVTAVGRKDGGGRSTQSGNYRDGDLVIDGNRYDVQRTGRGFRLIEARDTDNRTDYRRIR